MTNELPARDLRALENYTERLQQFHRGKKWHKKQAQVFDAIFNRGFKRVFIRKGRKGGGTETVLYPVGRIAGCYSDSACYIIGPTQNQQCEIIWHNNRLIRSLPDEWDPVPNKQEKRIALNNRSFIKVEGADDPEKARGWEGDVFVWDERKDHNPQSLEACYPNLASRDGIWIELGSPPNKKDSAYYKQEMVVKNDPDWFVINWSIWDNPFLPGGKDWIRKEKAKYIARGDEDLWEIEYEARYMFSGSSMVIPNFEPDLHVVDHDVMMARIVFDKSKLKWITMIDPGYSTCFAVMFAVYNPYTSEFWILDEIYSTVRARNSVADIWPKIMEIQDDLYPEGDWIQVYDSAAAQFPIEVNRTMRHKYPGRTGMRHTVKHKDDEESYYRLINNMFYTGRCQISTRCEKTVWELDNYETDKHGNYPDDNDHQLANFRYALKMIGYTSQETQIDNSGLLLPAGMERGRHMQKRQQEREEMAMLDMGDVMLDDILIEDML